MQSSGVGFASADCVGGLRGRPAAEGMDSHLCMSSMSRNVLEAACRMQSGCNEIDSTAPIMDIAVVLVWQTINLLHTTQLVP